MPSAFGTTTLGESFLRQVLVRLGGYVNFRLTNLGSCVILPVSDILNDNAVAIGKQFWVKCAQLIEVYPHRPDTFSGDSEPVAIGRELKAMTTDIASAVCVSEHWQGNASVGKGNWTWVPWVAFFDSRETTSAQKGVYPVIHFSCEDPIGMRLGLGVAATEFKSNPEAKAQEVSDQFPEDVRDQLRGARFIDVVAGNKPRIKFGTGNLATGYARGMVFERFVPLDELKANPDDLTEALRVLLQTYKSWADTTHGGEAPSPSFLEVMRWYAEQTIVFLSPNRQVRYLIAKVDDTGCEVRRLDADESERVTASAYQTKCQWLRERGGKASRADLDNTVAKHICYAQGSELGLSVDKKDVVVLDGARAAAEHFISLVESISSPQLYKPVILTLVIEAMGTSEAAENCITFDWVVPRFLERMKQLGREVTEQQAAEGFGRLAGDLFWMHAYHNPEQTLTSDKPTASLIRDRISHAVIKEPYWRALQDAKHRRSVLDAMARKWWPNMIDPPIPPGISAATEKLVADIATRGFVFQPWQIAAYITALRTKPFTILAGVSGTGKSKLPVLVAELTGMSKPRRIAVRPDWTDSSEVMGYVDLQNQFRPGVVLQQMRAASSNEGQYHVCLVDEMNLARVEHYFAEFLSAVEDRRAADGGGYQTSEILTQELPDDTDRWQSQCVPANLGIVGTVNMDETTHGFSRKVLDRAFTIELSEIDLSWIPNDGNNGVAEDGHAKWPLEHWLCPATRIDELNLSDTTVRQKVNLAIETLELVNESLTHSQLQVGYRTRDEVALFLVNASDVASSFVTRDGEPVDPLDLVLMMKILPRVVGGSNSIRRSLLGLLGFAKDGTPLTGEDDPADVMKAWDNDGRPAAYNGAKYPRTAARLCLMWERLEVEGYTSFWL